MRKILGALILIAVGGGVYYWQTHRSTESAQENPDLPSPLVDTVPDVEPSDQKCDAQDFRGDFKPEFDRWNDFLNKEVKWKESLAPQLEAFRQKNGFPLRFWGNVKTTETSSSEMITEDSALEPSIKNYVLDAHPCGFSMTAFVKKLPHASKVTDLIEQVKDDQVVRTWDTPIESDVVSIVGDDLIVSYPLHSVCGNCENCTGNVVYLKIHPNGEFSFTNSAESTLVNEMMDCPSGGGEAYCRVYSEGKSGPTRMLRLPAPCT